MNSNENTNEKKRKIKLIEDIDRNVSQSLNVKQKKHFFEQMVESINKFEEYNQTSDPKFKENYTKNHIFETETKLTIDEKDLEIRESFYKSQLKRPEFSDYSLIIERLDDNHLNLLNKHKVLAKQLMFWKSKSLTLDKEFTKTLKNEKISNWCRLCYRRAVVPFHCCRLGYYCSFTHLKSDRSHFVYCKKNENLDTNEDYTPLRCLSNKIKDKTITFPLIS